MELTKLHQSSVLYRTCFIRIIQCLIPYVFYSDYTVSNTVRVLFGLEVFDVIKSETDRMKVLPEPTSDASLSKHLFN